MCPENSETVRFGISIPRNLISAFDNYIKVRNYGSRSEAIRDLIREKLIEQDWEADSIDQPVVGTITYVFNHHKRELVDSILEIQHSFTDHVVVSQHVHLDHSNCIEVAIIRGRPSDLRGLAYKLKALKGIKHCRLTMTTSGAGLE